jgi:general secretion pathway protein A
MIHKTHFGFKTEPFARDIATENLLQLPSMGSVKERLDYCIRLGGVLIIFGEVGSGKSTSFCWVLSHYHPTELRNVDLVATTASITELYKQIAWGLDLVPKSMSRSTLLKENKAVIKELATARKQKVLIVVERQRKGSHADN